MKIPNDEETISVAEASKIAGVSPVTVRSAIQRGRLPAQELYRRVRVKRSDVEAWRAETTRGRLSKSELDAALYYHPEIQSLLVGRLEDVANGDAPARLDAAKRAALGAIEAKFEHLCLRACEMAVRAQFLKQTPTLKSIRTGKPLLVFIDVAAIREEERLVLRGALAAGDLAAIILRYPVRETMALHAIAEKLRFANRRTYENTVRRLIDEDVQMRALVDALGNSS